MAQYVPHYEDWRTVEKYRSFSSFFFYFVFFLSLVEAYKGHFIFNQSISTLVSILTIIVLIIYNVIELYIDLFLVPAVEDRRRSDFVDNSFGSHFITRNSVDYYTNDEINLGIYKAAVNLFENSLFSLRVLEKMSSKKIYFSGTIAVIVLMIAFWGFKDQPLAIPILQLFFSSVAFLDLVKFLYLRFRIEKLYNSWYSIFYIKPDHNSKEFISSVMHNWLIQETTLTKTQVGLDSKIFNELNPKVSQEWNQIKINLTIKNS